MATGEQPTCDRGALTVGRGHYRSPRWRRVSHGLYLPAEAPDSPALTCAALLRVLPRNARFGHLTGAALRGWWLPPLPPDLPVFVTVPAHSPRPQRKGLVVRRQHDACDWSAEVIDRVPVVPTVRVLQDLAADLCVLDLVVVLDSAIRAGDCTLTELRQASVVPRRGAVTLRKAISLADARSESPWETVLRLLYVLCGFPVTPQVWVRDADGLRLGRADLRLDGTTRLAEYDGASHRGKQQQCRDLARGRRLTRAGYQRYGYTNVDVIHRPSQVVRDAESAYGLTHDPRRVRPWLAQLRQSLFTPSGTRRLQRRWNGGP